MPANLTFDALKTAVKSGEIDTVIVCLIDMQGRMQGKRFHAAHFMENYDETHCCNYLLATDIEMGTVQGYTATSWQQGYGDYVMKPNLSTLRRLAWLEGTAMVMCDVLDHHTHEPVPHAPRTILKKQVARARAMGFEPMMATELEFFLFEESYPAMFDANYPAPTPIARYNVDYGIFGTSRDEPVMRQIRNDLYASGIPIECSKGEADAGQEEVNAKYSDAMDTADMHCIIKHGVKEIAQAHGHSATFMAKYDHRRAGSSSHVHQSLWQDGRNAFYDPDAEHGMSAVMRHFLAGQLDFAREITPFLAPNINSYKRFCEGMFAPTKTVWSRDNRTAGFRICGENTKGVRVECRIGGADLNPYLACAALLAAGLEGVENMSEPGAEFAGDLYGAKGAPTVPATLDEAAEAMKDSAMLNRAFGEDVVEHYYRAARHEIEQSRAVVTDWERMRGFERA